MTQNKDNGNKSTRPEAMTSVTTEVPVRKTVAVHVIQSGTRLRPRRVTGR